MSLDNQVLVPNFAEEWKVVCDAPECFASENGIISVVKIGWLIRCTCCGKSFSTEYFNKQLKKVGLL